MRTSPGSWTIGFAILLVALGWTVHGTHAAPEDEPAENGPGERYEAHAAGLPAPSDEAALRFDGELVLNGERGGTCRFEMKVREDEDGTRGWKARDDILFDGPRGSIVHLESWADLAPDLAPIRGAGVRIVTGQARTHVWERTPTGLRIETMTKPLAANAPDGTATLPHRGTVTTSMAAVVFLARSLLDHPGVVETTVWGPLENEKANALTALRLESKGRARFRGQEAWVVEGTLGRHTARLGFDLETRAFVGMILAAGDEIEIGFLPAGSGREPVPGEVLEKTGAADHLLEQGKAAEAAVLYTDALAVRATHLPALMGRARARFNQAQYEQAQADLDRVMQLAATSPAPYELQARLFERTGDAEGAVKSYSRILELDPDGPHRPEVFGRRGHVRMLAGDLPGAEQDYDRAIELRPDSAALRRGRGIVRERADRLEEAVEDFEEACAIDPSSPQDWFNLGLARMRAGNPKRAADAFSNALDRSRPHPIPLLRRAVARLESADEAGWLADVFAAARLAPREPAEVWPASPRTELAYAAALAAEGAGPVALRLLLAIRVEKDASVDRQATALLWEWVAHLGRGSTNPAGVAIGDFLQGASSDEPASWSVELLRYVVRETKASVLREKADAGTDADAKSARLAEALFVEGARALHRGETATARERLAATLATDAETTPAWFAAGILLGRLDGTEEAEVPSSD